MIIFILYICYIDQMRKSKRGSRKHIQDSWNPDKSEIVEIASEIGTREEVAVNPKLMKYLLKEYQQLNSKKTLFMTANMLLIVCKRS